jgi:hypothetical protein
MLIHAATTDLSTVMMLLNQLESLKGFTLASVLMPSWVMHEGKPAFESRYATNAYLLLEVAERAAAEAWWEEWADYLRTDLKTPFKDSEYEWIEGRLKTASG